jgi:hypothetical protein
MCSRVETFETKMSTLPSSSAARPTMVWTAAGSPTSAITAIARTLKLRASSATPSIAAWFRWQLMTTSAPSRANASAVARPIFWPEPVTSAVRR